MSARLFRARLLWWLAGLGVVLCLLGLWVGGWQGEPVLEPPAASADVVLAGSQEPIVPLPLHMPEIPLRSPWVNGCSMMYISPVKTPCRVPPVISWVKEGTTACREP